MLKILDMEFYLLTSHKQIECPKAEVTVWMKVIQQPAQALFPGF